MTTIARSALVLCATVCMAASAGTQTLVRALADQGVGSTMHGWAESHDSASGARQRALAECCTGGSGCTVRAWGCNGPVVEEGLGRDCAARRQFQEGLQTAGFDPGSAGGMFGPRTRAAIRSWQMSRGARATGYLDGASVATLPPLAGQPFRQREPVAGRPAGGAGPPASGSRVSGAGAGGVAAARRAGEVFRDCPECPEMVVLAGGGLAMGRYEVTVGEYRAFVSATGGTGDARWRGDPWIPQTDRHPVAFVNWDDTQEYVSWLSRRTGATYGLPTEAEWELAAAGSQPGCDLLGRGMRPDGTCPVGSHGSNAAGLSDMVGNLWEWTSDCWEGNCGRRVVRGGSWPDDAENLRLGARFGASSALREVIFGFRVSRTLD